METDTVRFKKEILTAGTKKHEAVIEDCRHRIREMMTPKSKVEEEEYDAHQQSYKVETVAEVSLLSDQLQFANHELDELRKIKTYFDEDHPVVEFGTVVTTDKATFFVAAEIEPFNVDGKPVSGLSVLSPLYKSMKGKRAGESFTHCGIPYRIEEIF